MICRLHTKIFIVDLPFVSLTGLLLREILLQVRHDVLQFARWTHSPYDWMRVTYDISIIGLDLDFELIQKESSSLPEVQSVETGPMSAQAALQPSRGQSHRLFPKSTPLLPSPVAFHTANTVPGIVHTFRTRGAAALGAKLLLAPGGSCLLAVLARNHLD